MLDCTELVSSQLTLFNLKIKLKHFPDQCDFSGSCLVSQQNICQPRKGQQSKRLAGAKECQGIAKFIPNFACMAKCLHDLIGPMNVKKYKQKGGKERGDHIR